MLISQELDGYYTPVVTRDYEMQSRHIAEISGRIITNYEHSRITSRRRWSRLLTLQHVTEVLAKKQLIVHPEQQIIKIMQAIFGAEDVVIALQSENEQYRVIGLNDAPEGRLRTLYVSDGPTGRAISEGTLIHTNDVRQSRTHDTLMLNAQSLIAAPLVTQGRTYGALSVGSSAANHWTEGDAQTVMNVANVLAFALAPVSAVDADTTAQSERTRRLEQAVVSLRRPLANLLECQQQLRNEASMLQPSLAFLESLAQAETLTARLAQAVGVPNDGPRKMNV